MQNSREIPPTPGARKVTVVERIEFDGPGNERRIAVQETEPLTIVDRLNNLEKRVNALTEKIERYKVPK